MSEKKFEECSLDEATYIEVGGKVHKLNYDKGNQVYRFNSSQIEVCRVAMGWQLIHVDVFPVLGIKPLREKKREPIEFIGFTKYVSRTLSHIINVPLGTPPQARFRCVEILEEEK